MADQETPAAATRATVRVPLAAEARVEFETFSGFLNETTANLSLGGMFLRTRYLKPVGSELRFELRLADAQPPVAGRGEVAWIRWQDDGRRRRAGMGIRFVELDTAGRELLYRVVDEQLKSGSWPLDLESGAPPPPRPAEAAVAAPETPAPVAPPVPAPEAVPSAPPAAPAGSPASSGTAAAATAPRPSWRIGGVALVAAGLLAGAAWWTLRDGEQARAALAVPASLAVADAGSGTPSPNSVPAAPVEAAAAPTLTRIERITWEATPGETVVWLWGDGIAAPGSHAESRLADSTPHAVVKLRGVRGVLAPARLEVGTPELRRIRVGEHRVAGSDELHVVLDLGQPEARLRAVDADGTRLRLRIGKP